ncbi:uncharacterized protein LOC116927236 [Daphnia magna]|uniref:uncharacterized protein LOC116927236 n=1 Tax=Daphnia magna TaxID=35525 RepID=UPI001E1BD359|nr:uncharacterized protein LOC116927236 [Daphnia magna]XP_045032927.1 uncharacterized protein LOC116927236 [Daphnia magna]
MQIDTQDPCGFPHFTRRKITLDRKKWRAISGGGRGTSASLPKPIRSSPRIENHITTEENYWSLEWSDYGRSKRGLNLADGALTASVTVTQEAVPLFIKSRRDSHVGFARSYFLVEKYGTRRGRSVSQLGSFYESFSHAIL